MGKEEYNNLMSMLVFLKIQNDTILQLILDREHGYKKNAYKTIYKEMVKMWEREYVLDEDEKEKRD